MNTYLFCVLWTSRVWIPGLCDHFPLRHGSKRSWNCKVSDIVNQARWMKWIMHTKPSKRVFECLMRGGLRTSFLCDSGSRFTINLYFPLSTIKYPGTGVHDPMNQLVGLLDQYNEMGWYLLWLTWCLGLDVAGGRFSCTTLEECNPRRGPNELVQDFSYQP